MTRRAQLAGFVLGSLLTLVFVAAHASVLGLPWQDVFRGSPGLWPLLLFPTLFGSLMGLMVAAAEGSRRSAALIAASMQRQEALRARLAQAVAILDLATDGIIIAQPDGKIEQIDSGSAALLQASRALSDAGNLDRVAIESGMSDESWHLDFRIGPLPDGREAYVLRDVGPLKRRMEQLARERARHAVMSAARRRYLAQVNHQLRSPVTALRVLSQVVVERATDSGDLETVGDAEEILRAADQVLGTLDEVRDLLRLESSAPSVVRERVDAARTIERLREDGVFSIGADRCELRSGLPMVFVDVQRFGAILHALERTLRTVGVGEPCLELGSSEAGERHIPLRLKVELSGRLRDEDAHSIEISRGPRSHSQLFGTSDLGMAFVIAAKAALLMDASVEILHRSSDALTLELRLPLADDEVTSEAPAVDPPVLIVESGRHLTSLLQGTSWRTETADAFHDAINLLARLQPRMVVLSTAMPHGQAWLFTTTMKTHPALGRAALLLVHTTPDDRLFVLPFTDLLLKPVEDRGMQSLAGITDGRGIHLVSSDELAAKAFVRLGAMHGVAVDWSAGPPEADGPLLVVDHDGLEPAVLETCLQASARSSAGAVLLLANDPERDQLDLVTARIQQLPGLAGQLRSPTGVVAERLDQLMSSVRRPASTPGGKQPAHDTVVVPSGAPTPQRDS